MITEDKSASGLYSLFPANERLVDFRVENIHFFSVPLTLYTVCD